MEVIKNLELKFLTVGKQKISTISILGIDLLKF
jgi:hypothetical protein